MKDNGQAAPKKAVKGETMGSRLKALRLSRGWTGNRMAVLADLHPQTLVQVEAGDSMSLATLGKLSKVLEVSPPRLLAYLSGIFALEDLDAD